MKSSKPLLHLHCNNGYLFTHGNRTGCRFITVDAYHDAVGFYQKCGFDFISEKDQHDPTRSMYYDLKRFLDE